MDPQVAKFPGHTQGIQGAVFPVGCSVKPAKTTGSLQERELNITLRLASDAGKSLCPCDGNHECKQAGARSLRVAVVFVVIIVIFFAVAPVFLFVFVFVFVLVWLLSKEDIGSFRPTKRVRVGAFWTYSAHAQWYAS